MEFDGKKIEYNMYEAMKHPPDDLPLHSVDIVKPLGVRRMEQIGGGWGVMLDDILAGVYGAIVLFLINMIL